MKNAIKLFVVIAMTISASIVNANETTFKVDVVGEKKFRVEVSDIKGISMAYIKDDKGQILYKSKSKDAFFRTTYDLSKLKVGKYDLVVKDEFKVQTLPLSVTTEGIVIEKLEKTFFPIIETEDDMLLVKLLSDVSNDLTINVRTLDGDLLSHNKVEGQLGLIGKRYKFNPGSYAITVKSDDFIDTSYITIK